MSIFQDKIYDELSTNNKQIMPLGLHLTNSGTRTLFPYEGAIAYDQTTQTFCFGNGSVWTSLSGGGGPGGPFQGFSNILTFNNLAIPTGFFAYASLTSPANADQFSVGINGSGVPTTIPQAGYYHITAQATFDISGLTKLAQTSLGLTMTGAPTNFANVIKVVPSTPNPVTLTLEYDVHYVMGQIVELQCYCDYTPSPGPDGVIRLKSSNSDGVLTWYSIVKIG
jgi:hypothetical protein